MFNFQRHKTKVFCIGPQGTGGLRVKAALAALGYRTAVWDKDKAQTMTDLMLAGEIGKLCRFAYDRDGFANLPWSALYKELDAHFPNAKFVLTVPRDEKAWLNKAHRAMIEGLRKRLSAKNVEDIVAHNYLFLNSSLDGFKKHYEQNLKDIRKHFASRPGKLLEMCIEKGDGWNKLCTFLDAAPVPNGPFIVVGEKSKEKKALAAEPTPPEKNKAKQAPAKQ